MPKARRKTKVKGTAVPLDSDDEANFAKERVPDTRSDDFYHDEIDQFHSSRDKILLDKAAAMEPADDSTDEEEVYAVGEDDSDDEIQEYKARLKMLKSKSFKDKYGSDLEDSEDGLPSDKAWGHGKSRYYGADVSDEDLEESESEEEAAKLEEQEARVIQQRLASQLHDKDLGLDLFQPSEKEPKTIEKEESQKKIVKDLSKMSKKEKLKLLNKESPELLNLINEYKSKMKELKDRLFPIHKLIKDGSLPPSSAADFIEAQVRLYVNYCLNISFYLVLKSQHKPVQDHPVIQRILQFRQLIDQLNVQQDKMNPLVDDILEKINSGEEIVKRDVPEKKLSLITKIRQQKAIQEKKKKLLEKKKKMLERKKMEEEEEESDGMEEVLPPGGGGGRRKRKEQQEVTEEIEENDRKKSRKSGDGEDEDDLGARLGGDENVGNEGDEYEEFDGDEKRGITYEMEKNKGLTAKRKKIDRNPRVKNRMKYRKAKIRRRGQIREVRTEMTKYTGELHGIRAGIKRSIKMK